MSTQYHQFDSVEKGIKKHQKAKIAGLAFVVGAILSALIFWGISTIINKENGSSTGCTSSSIQQPTNEQSDALSNVRTVFLRSTWNGTLMTDDDKDKIEAAYDIFDENGDEKWSYPEFLTFELFLSNHSSILFYEMDVDDDSIVSVREFVTFLLNFNGVSNYILQKRFEHLVYDRYGLDEINTTSKSEKFYQYVADIYYENFDKYGKGYFNLSDWQYMFYNNSFIRYDENRDDFISFEEFLEGQFQQKTINNPSKEFILFRNALNGDPKSYKNYYTLNKYDYKDVAAINLTWTCPITEYSGNKEVTNPVRRRLGPIACVSSSLGCASGVIGATVTCVPRKGDFDTVIDAGLYGLNCVGAALGATGACLGIINCAL